MTTTADGKVNLGGVPLGDGAQPPTGEPQGADARCAREGKRLRVTDRVKIDAALSGASVIHAKWDSVAEVWAGHAASAEHSAWPLVKWGRLAWGAWHTGIEVPLCRGWEWSGKSFSRRCGCLLILAAIAWLLGLVKF